MRRHKLLALFLVLALVRGLIYTAITPPWQSPDEPYHLLSAFLPNLGEGTASTETWQHIKSEVVQSLVDFRFWERIVHVPAVQKEDEVLANLPRGFSFTSDSKPRSFAYYLLSLWLTPVASQSVIVQLYWARVLSVLVNLVIVSLAYATARLLFKDEPFGLVLLPLSVVFLPQHTFILAAVSDGNLAELFASLAVFFLLWGLIKGWDWVKALSVLLFTILAVATKPTGVYLVVVLVAGGAIYGWRRMSGLARLVLIPALASIVYAATLVSRRTFVALRALWRLGLGGGETARPWWLISQASFDTFRGFWANLGWTSLPVSEAWGYVMIVLCVLAGLGLFKALFTSSPGSLEEKPVSREIILVLGLCALSAVVVVFVSFLFGRPSLYESRYLFGAIIPIMALLVIGWRELLPSAWRLEGLAALTSFFFLFDMVVLLNYAVPFFYPLWRH